MAAPNRNIIKSRGSSVGVVFDVRDGLVGNFTRFCASFTLPTADPVWDKVHPATGHDGPEGEVRYGSTLSWTSALDEGGWSTPRPGRFTSGKETSSPPYWRLGGSQRRSGRVWKVSSVPGLDPRTVQPVASCYSITCIGQWKRRTFRPVMLYRCLQWPRLFKRCTSNSEWALDSILIQNTDRDIRGDSVPQYRYGH